MFITRISLEQICHLQSSNFQSTWPLFSTACTIFACKDEYHRDTCKAGQSAKFTFDKLKTRHVCAVCKVFRCWSLANFWKQLWGFSFPCSPEVRYFLKTKFTQFSVAILFPSQLPQHFSIFASKKRTVLQDGFSGNRASYECHEKRWNRLAPRFPHC